MVTIKKNIKGRLHMGAGPGAKTRGMDRIWMRRKEHIVNLRCEQRPRGENKYHTNTGPHQLKQMILTTSSYK